MRRRREYLRAHIKEKVIDHHKEKLFISKRKVNIKTLFQKESLSPNFIISKHHIKDLSYIISKRQLQGIVHPLARVLIWASFYPFLQIPCLAMPCGTAPSTLSAEPFLFRRRRNRNGSGFQNDNHNHFKGTIILSYIISKGGAFVISKKPSYLIFH